MGSRWTAHGGIEGASVLKLLTQLFLDGGVFGPCRSHFLSRKSFVSS